MRTARTLAALVVTAAVLMAPGAGWGASVHGTCTVSDADGDVPEGYHKYVLDITWDTSGMGGHAMGHLSLLLDLGVCPHECEDGIVIFDDPAGSGLGEGGCDLEYRGSYNCYGDPSFPEPTPIIKFEPDTGGCATGVTGTAELTFYTSLLPSEDLTHSGAIGIKAGEEIDYGDIVGRLPVCGDTAVEAATWSFVKLLYR